MSNKQAAVDWNTVLRYLAGGALVGGGVGAGTSVARYLSHLQRKAKAQDTLKDDDVLYLNLPADPTASPAAKMASGDNANTASTFAMSGLAGMAGLIGAYNLVRSTYTNMRRKQVQSDLDAAQQAYLGGLQTSNSLAKSAADDHRPQFGMLSKGMGSAYLMGLLAIMGSGVVTNKVLNKYFPPLKSPLKGRPRKIVVRTMPPAEAAGAVPPNDDDAIGMEKTIPVPDGMSQPEEIEGLIRQNDALAKTAGVKGPTDMDDLLAAVALGRGDEIKEALVQGMDPTDVLSLVKGASAQPVDNLRHNLAIGWVAHDPLVSEAFAPLIAAEFNHFAPSYVKMARGLSAEEQANLAGLVGALNEDIRSMSFEPVLVRLSQTKSAAGLPHLLKSPLMGNLVLANALRDLLSQQGAAGLGQSDQSDQTGQSGESGADGQPDQQGQLGDAGSEQPLGEDAQEQTPGLAGSLTGSNSTDSADAATPEQRAARLARQPRSQRPQRPQRKTTLQVEDPVAARFVAKNRDIIDEALTRTA